MADRRIDAAVEQAMVPMWQDIDKYVADLVPTILEKDNQWRQKYPEKAAQFPRIDLSGTLIE